MVEQPPLGRPTPSVTGFCYTELVLATGIANPAEYGGQQDDPHSRPAWLLQRADRGPSASPSPARELHIRPRPPCLPCEIRIASGCKLCLSAAARDIRQGSRIFLADVSPGLAIRLTRSSTRDILTPLDPQCHPSLIGVPLSPKFSKTPIEPQFPPFPLFGRWKRGTSGSVGGANGGQMVPRWVMVRGQPFHFDCQPLVVVVIRLLLSLHVSLVPVF